MQEIVDACGLRNSRIIDTLGRYLPAAEFIQVRNRRKAALIERKRPYTGFSSERADAHLTRLWATPLPTREIAASLTMLLGKQVTKNMVIGRARTIGLPRRQTGRRKRRGTL